MEKKTDENEVAGNLWQFNVNLGEMAFDILDVDGEILIVLGERNIFCFDNKGNMKFMIHLDYSPICFHGYVQGI